MRQPWTLVQGRVRTQTWKSRGDDMWTRLIACRRSATLTLHTWVETQGYRIASLRDSDAAARSRRYGRSNQDNTKPSSMIPTGQSDSK